MQVLPEARSFGRIRLRKGILVVIAFLVFCIHSASSVSEQSSTSWQSRRRQENLQSDRVVVRYPQLSGDSWDTKLLNARLRGLVDKHINKAKDDFSLGEFDQESGPPGYLNAGYEIQNFTPEFVAIRINYDGYCANAAHNKVWSEFLNFYQNPPRQIAAQELFKDNFDYRKFLAKRCCAELQKGGDYSNVTPEYLEDQMDNFCLAEGELIFQLHELSAASATETAEVRLPYSSVRPVLNPQSVIGKIGIRGCGPCAALRCNLRKAYSANAEYAEFDQIYWSWSSRRLSEDRPLVWGKSQKPHQKNAHLAGMVDSLVNSPLKVRRVGNSSRSRPNLHLPNWVLLGSIPAWRTWIAKVLLDSVGSWHS
jgi:hypothetical protein